MSEDKKAMKIDDENLEGVSGGFIMLNSAAPSHAVYQKGTDKGISTADFNEATKGDINLLGNAGMNNVKGNDQDIKSSSVIPGRLQKA
ncbi:MAG: hypothetical protein K6G03_10230 [Lachnospiraceae bacterium]|nr:hypothetical protein [Lachnospiraceae bacterium]